MGGVKWLNTSRLFSLIWYLRSDTYLTSFPLTRNIKFFSLNFICKEKTVQDMSLKFACTELATIFKIALIIENPALPILLQMWWACKTNLPMVTTICKHQYHWYTNGNHLAIEKCEWNNIISYETKLYHLKHCHIVSYGTIYVYIMCCNIVAFCIIS